MSEYDAVVYDLDGTLVDLPVDWSRVRTDVEAVLRDAGADPEGLVTWELYDCAEAVGVATEVEEIIASAERTSAADAAALPLLADVRESATPAAVCSLNCEAACRIALDRHDAGERFAAVVGRDTVPARKPDPAALHRAIEALDVPPERVLFVGDADRDAETARRAGTGFEYV
ncbi:HAD family hydrolase [Halocalculus aciditolerans]|uniref:HAD family hydrolase n=1 Tax=Halocalculus aciditolerans TaxID=1383812 RepID=UPI002DDAA6A9|nr:HAD-IA family hydrolase [Halocalculus aciditolerans]